MSGHDKHHFAPDLLLGGNPETFPGVKLLDAETAVLPEHDERHVAAQVDVIRIGIVDSQRKPQRIARGDSFGKPREGDVHKAGRMEMRIDEPRETLAVGQYDAPNAARRVGFVIRRLDQHFAAGKARIVVTELPLVGPVADIGLAVGLSAGIEGVFGCNGVTVAENDGTAVGDFGDLPVTGAVVEHFVTDAQRIEDHHQPRQGDQGERHPPHAHQVAARPGMTPGVGEERIEQSEHGDDHPLGLDVSAQRRKQKKTINAAGMNFSERSTAFCGFTAIHDRT